MRTTGPRVLQVRIWAVQQRRCQAPLPVPGRGRAESCPLLPSAPTRRSLWMLSSTGQGNLCRCTPVCPSQMSDTPPSGHPIMPRRIPVALLVSLAVAIAGCSKDQPSQLEVRTLVLAGPLRRPAGGHNRLRAARSARRPGHRRQLRCPWFKDTTGQPVEGQRVDFRNLDGHATLSAQVDATGASGCAAAVLTLRRPCSMGVLGKSGGCRPR
jgi:hypothetical protein